MKIIKGVRGSGKTYELLKESGETNTPILCAGPSQQRFLEMMSEVYQTSIPKPVLLEDLESLHLKAVLIDDLIPTLERILGTKISGYSETLGDREDNIILELNKQYGDRQ